MPDTQAISSTEMQNLFDDYLVKVDHSRSYQVQVKPSGQTKMSWLLADGRTCILRLKGNSLSLDIVDLDGNAFTLSSLNTVKVFMVTVFS